MLLKNARTQREHQCKKILIMENNKEEQLNDKQLKEVSGGQEALNSWVDEPMKKREEVLKAIEELMNCFKPKH